MKRRTYTGEAVLILLQGFGRAIILYGMRQLAAAGMELATVAHFGNNAAARGLYQACGFKPWHLLDGYIKHFPKISGLEK